MSTNSTIEEVFELKSKSASGSELVFRFSMQKLKENMSHSEGQKLFEIAYQKTIDNLSNFLSYAIGSHDTDSINILNDAMINIANSKMENR